MLVMGKATDVMGKATRFSFVIEWQKFAQKTTAQ
jgi:hypothetical protein